MIELFWVFDIVNANNGIDVNNGTDVNISNSISAAIKSRSVGKGKKKWPVYFRFGGISGVKILALQNLTPTP